MYLEKQRSRKKEKRIKIIKNIFCLICIIFFLILINLYQKNYKYYGKEKLREQNYSFKQNTYGNFRKNLSKISKDKKWSLSIPGILKEAEIKESVKDYVLNEYIGHFETTKFLDGNVCLAAHNRGFYRNYFKNLKDINLNDEIIYIVGDSKFKYIVSEKYIINEYDLSPLYERGKREMTLITCVSNKPSERLVVKAKYIGLKN